MNDPANAGFTQAVRCATDSSMVEKERVRLLARAKEIDLVLNEALVAGVIENRELLEQHRALVARFLAEHHDL